MKIVIDTSVWISALITKDSKAREILKMVLKKELYPQISEALFYSSRHFLKSSNFNRSKTPTKSFSLNS